MNTGSECTSWDRKLFIGKFVVFLSAFLFILGWRPENVHNDWRPEPGRDVQEGHKNGAGSHGTLQDLVKSIIRSDIKSHAIDSLFFHNFHLSTTHCIFLISLLQFSTFFPINNHRKNVKYMYFCNFSTGLLDF